VRFCRIGGCEIIHTLAQFHASLHVEGNVVSSPDSDIGKVRTWVAELHRRVYVFRGISDG
jgi:hypothetical protein